MARSTTGEGEQVLLATEDVFTYSCKFIQRFYDVKQKAASENRQNSKACEHDLLCEQLRTLFLDYYLTFNDVNEIVFPEDSDPICSQCKYFESKNNASAQRTRSVLHFLKVSN